MTAMNNSQFAERALKLARAAPAFQPSATYDPDGDCIEFLAAADPFYAERIDDLVTVYYSQETNEIIGSLIKGVSGFCKKMLEKLPGFRIEIQDGGVKVTHIFLAKLWAEPDASKMTTLTYRKLIEVAEKATSGRRWRA